MTRIRDGFTLVELLVSVAIVGILAAVALANFKEYRIKAYDTTAMALSRELCTANVILRNELLQTSFTPAQFPSYDPYFAGNWSGCGAPTEANFAGITSVFKIIPPSLASGGSEFQISVGFTDGPTRLDYYNMHCLGKTVYMGIGGKNPVPDTSQYDMITNQWCAPCGFR